MCVLRCVLRALMSIVSMSLVPCVAGAPMALQPGSVVTEFASGGVLNATANGGFFLGGLEVDPATGSVYLIAHNVPVWGFSTEVQFIEVPLTGVPMLSGTPFGPVEQQTRGNDLTLKDGFFYFAGRRGVVNGIYGFQPGTSDLGVYAAGAGIPRWATSGLTFSADGTMSRVTSNAGLGHYMVEEGSTTGTQVVTEQALPTGMGGAASDHVITRNGRIIAIGESSRQLLDISNGAGNVTVFFDLNSIEGVNVNDGAFGSRGTVDPVSGDIFVSYAVDSAKIYRVKEDGSSAILFADGFTGTIRDIDFGPATDGSGLQNLFVSAIDAPSTGAVYEFTVPQDDRPPNPMGCVPWNNGLPDNLRLLQVQDFGDGSEYRVADDCVFFEGDSFYIESIRLVLAVELQPESVLDVRLEIYEDCDGMPGALSSVIEDFEAIPLGPIPGGELELYEFEFPVNKMHFAGTYLRQWISPVGESGGWYYWITSRNGVVQGKQAKVISGGCGIPGEWIDGDDLTCFPFCSDMNFVVTGDCCKPLVDQSTFADEGLPSQNPNVYGARSADDFQIPPGLCARELCSIEVWMAMNCPPEKTLLELYSNECDTIIGDPIDVLIDPEVFDTGRTIEYRNEILTIYRLVWRAPEIVLPAGANYWVVPIGYTSLSATSHSLFLFHDGQPCPISINEGLFRNPPKGYPDWLPTSQVTMGGEAKDFSMRVWVRELDQADAGSEEDPQPELSKPPVEVAPFEQLHEKWLLRTGHFR